jgi:hypothetical protein
VLVDVVGDDLLGNLSLAVAVDAHVRRQSQLAQTVRGYKTSIGPRAIIDDGGNGPAAEPLLTIRASHAVVNVNAQIATLVRVAART